MVFLTNLLFDDMADSMIETVKRLTKQFLQAYVYANFKTGDVKRSPVLKIFYVKFTSSSEFSKRKNTENLELETP